MQIRSSKYLKLRIVYLRLNEGKKNNIYCCLAFLSSPQRISLVFELSLCSFFSASFSQKKTNSYSSLRLKIHFFCTSYKCLCVSYNMLAPYSLYSSYSRCSNLVVSFLASRTIAEWMNAGCCLTHRLPRTLLWR